MFVGLDSPLAQGILPRGRKVTVVSPRHGFAQRVTMKLTQKLRGFMRMMITVIERGMFRSSRGLFLAWQMLPLNTLMARSGNEPSVSRFACTMRGELFVDVGANIGFYTRLLKNNFRRIVAIEADPLTYAYLAKSMPKNCEAINAAVVDYNGDTYLHIHPYNPGGSSVAYGLAAGWKPIRVRAMTLSSLLGVELGGDWGKVDV